jgi:hypothetical protein
MYNEFSDQANIQTPTPIIPPKTREAPIVTPAFWLDVELLDVLGTVAVAEVDVCVTEPEAEVDMDEDVVEMAGAGEELEALKNMEIFELVAV